MEADRKIESFSNHAKGKDRGSCLHNSGMKSVWREVLLCKMDETAGGLHN
jgi:hypothetical protein